MTDTADVILFAYSLVLVGFVLGAQMLYVGAVERRELRIGGKTIAPRALVSVGAAFSAAGALALAVMAAEVLSGAAGTDLRPFGIATILIPPVVLWFNARQP